MIEFPPLEPSTRDREYNLCSYEQRAKIVYGYLFEGLSHRKLDKDIFHDIDNKNRGFLSMNTLHFLGLRNAHKGVFANKNPNDIIKHLENLKDSSLLEIINYLKLYLDKKVIFNQSDWENDFLRQITQSFESSAKDRQDRLRQRKDVKPKQVNVLSIAYIRNPDVVVEVLLRANGVCERCNKKAPFIKASSGQPYLEVHHIIRLADGGNDTVENAIALCPNCHREAHFG